MRHLLRPQSLPCSTLKAAQALPRISIRNSSATSTTTSATAPTAPKPRDYLQFPPAALSAHWDTLPPTPAQLKHANLFFTNQPPAFLWSAPKFHSMDFGHSPEVCFLGRSNVGKSSLLNALLNRRAIAHVSSKPGRTREMNAFAVGGDPVADGGGDNGKNRLVVLDMPGYGKGGRAEWGKEILKYLGQRKELKRAFLLIDSEHGIKTSDEQLLALFRQQGIPHQVVLSKVDKVLFPKSRVPSEGALKARFEMLDEMMEEVRRKVQPGGIEGLGNGLGEVIACSAEKSSVAAGMGNAGRLGIDSVRHAMLQAAELEYREPKKKISPVETVSFDDIIWAGEK